MQSSMLWCMSHQDWNERTTTRTTTSQENQDPAFQVCLLMDSRPLSLSPRGKPAIHYLLTPQRQKLPSSIWRTNTTETQIMTTLLDMAPALKQTVYNHSSHPHLSLLYQETSGSSTPSTDVHCIQILQNQKGFKHPWSPHPHSPSSTFVPTVTSMQLSSLCSAVAHHPPVSPAVAQTFISCPGPPC